MSRSGRGKHIHNRARTQQTNDLPPRCFHCRVSWDTTMINGETHCQTHLAVCDGTCSREERETSE